MSKKVTLKELTLINFKGVRNLTVKFGEVTNICGRNATGKTTVFDAFTWVLFGKDSQGNQDSNFGIKTVDSNGNPIEKIDHEVTAVLDVDGQETTLRRVFVEDWVKPRGSAETILKGNHTDYYCNGIEVKAAAYKAKVAEIVEEQLFKMITSPYYFVSLDWKSQREILLQLAGGVTFEDVAQSRKDFIALLSQLSGKDLAIFKEELAYRKKKIQEDLNKIPTRIDELVRNTPVTQDFEALELEKQRLTEELEQIDRSITDYAEAMRQHYEKVQARQKQVNALKAQQQDLIFKAKQEAQKNGFERNAKARELRNKYDSLNREAETYYKTSEREIEDLEARIKQGKNGVSDLESQVNAKREEWYKRNEETYTQSEEGLVCPIYKTLCHDNKALELAAEGRAKALQAFNEKKASDLDKINQEGEELTQRIDKGNKYIEELEQKLSELKADSSEKKNAFATEIARLADEILATPLVEINTDIKGEDLPEWVTLEAQIKAIPPVAEEAMPGDNSELTNKKKSLASQLDEVKRKLNLRSVIENNGKRKEELLKQERELAQQKADLEKQEFTADELTKARMEEVERRINDKFQRVRFRMYDRQINGGEKPDCILISKATGARYTDTNNADKINIGLDIINTLCLYYGVSAPVFVDNAEGVNELFPVDSQIVKLIVTNDSELTIY